MEGTDSKCPPALQVRRGHPTVHSETKYVELIVINDHQLVSSQAEGDPGRRGPGEPRLLPHLSRQFEQMRQSVVLTSNFAKSVVNLADVVSSTPAPLSSSFPHHTARHSGVTVSHWPPFLENIDCTFPPDPPHLLSGPRYTRSSSTQELCWLPWKRGQMATRSRCRMTYWRPWPGLWSTGGRVYLSPVMPPTSSRESPTRHPASFCQLACSDCLCQEMFVELVSAGGACLAPDTCSQPHVPAECPLPLRLGKGCALCLSLARLPIVSTSATQYPSEGPAQFEALGPLV